MAKQKSSVHTILSADKQPKMFHPSTTAKTQEAKTQPPSTGAHHKLKAVTKKISNKLSLRFQNNQTFPRTPQNRAAAHRIQRWWRRILWKREEYFKDLKEVERRIIANGIKKGFCGALSHLQSHKSDASDRQRKHDKTTEDKAFNTPDAHDPFSDSPRLRKIHLAHGPAPSKPANPETKLENAFASRIDSANGYFKRLHHSRVEALLGERVEGGGGDKTKDGDEHNRGKEDNAEGSEKGDAANSKSEENRNTSDDTAKPSLASPPTAQKRPDIISAEDKFSVKRTLPLFQPEEWNFRRALKRGAKDIPTGGFFSVEGRGVVAGVRKNSSNVPEVKLKLPPNFLHAALPNIEHSAILPVKWKPLRIPAIGGFSVVHKHVCKTEEVVKSAQVVRGMQNVEFLGQHAPQVEDNSDSAKNQNGKVQKPQQQVQEDVLRVTWIPTGRELRSSGGNGNEQNMKVQSPAESAPRSPTSLRKRSPRKSPISPTLRKTGGIKITGPVLGRGK